MSTLFKSKNKLLLKKVFLLNLVSIMGVMNSRSREILCFEILYKLPFIPTHGCPYFLRNFRVESPPERRGATATTTTNMP